MFKDDDDENTPQRRPIHEGDTIYTIKRPYVGQIMKELHTNTVQKQDITA